MVLCASGPARHAERQQCRSFRKRSAFHTFPRKLERLQAAYAAHLNKPVASRFLAFDPYHTAADYDRLREQELDRMVETGEIKPNQRSRVKFMRWMTATENADRAQLEVDGPVPAPVHVHGQEVAPDPVITTPDVQYAQASFLGSPRRAQCQVQSATRCARFGYHLITDHMPYNAKMWAAAYISELHDVVI